MNELFAWLQQLLPQHALSRFAGRVAASRAGWVRKLTIQNFARYYRVNMAEAKRPSLDDYVCFNDFFTRSLRAGTRPADADPLALVAPADGLISQAGQLERGELLQAKGTRYRLDTLIADHAETFDGGSFVTVYLAPRDYHRVHLPAAGTLTATTAIPGRLFSVNARTEAAVSDLFCRNERLVCRFDTDHGALLVVLVGALIVGRIDTVWGGPASPYRRVLRDHWQIPIARGAEIGRFLLGSTVIVCCEPGRVRWEPRIQRGERVQVGQRLGTFVGGRG